MGFGGDISRDYEFDIIFNPFEGETYTMGGTIYVKEWEKLQLKYDITWSIVVKSSDGVILEEYNSDSEGDSFTLSMLNVDEEIQNEKDNFIEFAQDLDFFEDYLPFDARELYTIVNKTPREEEVVEEIVEEENPTTPGEIPPPYPNTDSPYSVYLPGNSNIKGSINIESGGLEKKAVINIEGSTKGGTDIKIDLTGAPSITAEDDVLASEIIVNANNTLENEYNIEGDFKYEKQPGPTEPPPPPKFEYEITGKIVDEETQQPLGGATIKDLTNNSNTTSDPAGDFILKGTYEEDLNPPTLEDPPQNELWYIINNNTNADIPSSTIKLFNSDTLPNRKISALVDYVDPLNKGTLIDNSQKFRYLLYDKDLDDPTPSLVNMLVEGALQELKNKVNDSNFDNQDGGFGENNVIPSSFLSTKPQNLPVPPPPPRTGPAAPPFDLEISFKDYTASTLPAVNLNGSVKSTIGIVQLKPVEANTDEAKMELENYDDTQQNLLKKETKKGFVISQLEKLFNTIKTNLVPAALSIAALFGISQLPKLLQKAKTEGMGAVKKELEAQGVSCPADIEGLNKIIDKKNKLTKQINNLEKGIDKINKFLSPIDKLISATEKGVNAAKIAANGIAFIPSTVGTPIPSGAYTKINDGLKTLSDLLDSEGGKIKGGFFQLDFLKAEISKITTLMGILDTLCQGCAEEIVEKENKDGSSKSSSEGKWILESGDGINGTPSDPPPPPQANGSGPKSPYNDGSGIWIWVPNNNNGLKTQESISSNLLQSSEDQSNQGSPVITNVNGFTMGVVSIPNSAIKGLSRRQATATDQYGVIVLRGKPSFSSIDQVLIDELVFYIQTNDLKAN